MATLVADAIEIVTDDGTGIPTSYSNTAIGLAADGHFYLITERFGLSGGKTITGDTAQGTWYEEILARDESAFSISRNCDFVEAGALEEVSGLSFGIKNTAAFWSTLQANGVNLGRRTVKYYRVTSTDGTTFNFELRWTGVIDDQPFDELTYSVQCVDASKDIFKSTPTESVNDATFEDAPEDSKDKVIPIALGRVGYSPLVGVTKPGNKIVLVINEEIEFTSCGLTSYNSSTRQTNLYTKGIQFSADDARLVNSMLTVIAGGDSQSIRILSNAATDPSTEKTLVTMEEPFTTDSTAFTAWASGETTSSMWFAEVQTVTALFLASTNPVYQFQENAFGRALLSSYSSESKKFQDMSDVSRLYSTSNIKSTGHPGADIFSKSLDIDGDASAYFKIRAKDITFNSDTGALNFTYSGPSGSQADLFDEDQSTGYAFASVPDSIGSLELKLSIPQSIKDESFDDLYVLVDFVHNLTAGTAPSISVSLQIYGEDIYGQPTGSIASAALYLDSLTTTEVSVSSIHGVYYNSEETPDLFYTLKGNLSLSSILDNVKKARAFPKITLQFTFIADDYEGELREIALIGKRTINVSSDQIYAGLIGETYQTTWGGRFAAANPIETVPQAFEKLLRDYDTDAPIWLAGKAYVVGDKIRSTADNGHIFVCTTAGTSDATEPVWTTTPGDTYTDGTAAWQEFKAFPIDTASFDALSSLRSNWLIGRTLVEKKNSEEWYKELCAQGFLLATMSPEGKVGVKAWLEDTTAVATFDSSNIIEGTLGQMTLTPMQKMYNDLLIRYDWNPGAGKFNKQIAVTKVDKPAFPDSDQIVDQAITDLGVFTMEAVNLVTLGGVLYSKFKATTTDVHNLSTGDYVRLIGNTDGFSFTPTQVSVESTTVFYVYVQSYPTSNPSSTGTLSKVDITQLAWKTYVTGIENYATAQALWEQCHDSYLVTKAVRKLPQELGDCYWYFDNYAKNPGGGYIWSDDGGVTCNLDFGDEHSAVYFTQWLTTWAPWQKKQNTFEVIDSATYSALKIGTPVNLNDAKLTGGVDLLGWIHEKTQLPATDKLPHRFRFGVTFRPEAYVDHLIIDEMGATDIIDEDSASNIYDEVGA